MSYPRRLQEESSGLEQTNPSAHCRRILLRPERTEPEVLQNPKNGSTAEEGKAGEKTHCVRSGHIPGTHWCDLWKVYKKTKTHHIWRHFQRGKMESSDSWFWVRAVSSSPS